MKNFKRFYLLLLGLLIAMMMFNIPIIFAAGLVPDTVNTSPDYYCTWQTQLYYTNNGGPAAQRANITETTMFGTGAYQGWTNFYPNARRDLMIVMDDSWDIPLNGDTNYYGSLVLNSQRFPSYARSGVSAQDAMKNLVTAVKAKGWITIGGWVCAQESPVYLNGRTQQQYWTERLQWSQYSGWGLWKIDWGNHATDGAWRKMVTDLSHQYATNLTVEQAMQWADQSDLYRTYDVPAIMSIPRTLTKLKDGFIWNRDHQASGYKRIFNCEDEVYTAAALGCTMGVMRHPYAGNLPNGQPDPSFPSMHRNLKTKIDEVTRAVRWHRIAPAYGGTYNDISIDSNYLTDSWTIQNQAAEVEAWWGFKNGDTMSDSAPARITRGLPLPVVIPDGNGDVPFVIASKNPNGAVSIAALCRTRSRSYWMPRCSITLSTGNATTYGIFGHYGSLTLSTSLNLANATIKAQDLAGSVVKDITSQVTRNGSQLVIPGSVIDSVGMGEQTPGDTSEPGLVLVISGTSPGPTPTPTSTPTPGGIVSGATYKILSRSSGKLIEVTGNSTADGALIEQWTDNGGNNQKWRVDDMGNGNYRLTNINSSKVLDVPNGSASTGTQLEQWTDNGGNNQRFKIVSVVSGYYKIVNVNNNLALDVNGNSTSDGAGIIQWTDNGQTNQQWQFVKQ